MKKRKDCIKAAVYREKLALEKGEKV